MFQVFIEDLYDQSGIYGSTNGVPVEPISLATAKNYIRVDYPDDDQVIQSMITMARKQIEKYCNISILQRFITLSLQVRYRPTSSNTTQYQQMQAMQPFELPHGPVTNIINVSSIDQYGNVITNVLNQDYFVKGNLFQYMWFLNPQEYYVIMYNTGYATCPDELQLAILAQLSYLYENRGEEDKQSGFSALARQMAEMHRRLYWQ